MSPFYLLAFFLSVHCVRPHLSELKLSTGVNNSENSTKKNKEAKPADEDRSQLGYCFDINRKVRIPYFISRNFFPIHFVIECTVDEILRLEREKFKKTGNILKADYHREIILKGLADYESHTCLKFEVLKPLVRHFDDFLIHFKYVSETYPECNNTHYFEDDGKYNSRTVIRLNEKLCLNDSGRVEQLILSALGFIHEDARSDRDDYVTVLWDNIKLGHEGFFRKVKENVQNWVLPYDFLSISNHYSDFHSEGGKPTLAWKDSKRPYQRNIRLSPLDVYKINSVFCRCQMPNSSTTDLETDQDNEIFNQFGKFHLHVSFFDDLRRSKTISKQ